MFAEQTLTGRILFVYSLNNSFVKLYSLGKEIKYYGKCIEYDDSKTVFLIFHYSKLTRLYIINGVLENDVLVQVKPKINKILCCDGKVARRFILFINEKKEDSFLFEVPPLFWREAYNFIDSSKNYMDKLNLLYEKYREDIINGINYPNY